MAQTTSESPSLGERRQSTRAWPALFQAGFRPFFLLGAAMAVATVARTALIFAGVDVPHGNPFAWHGHEMLLGYIAAVIAGFILTAVPNWTGTHAFTGLPLLILAGIWLVARIGLWEGNPAGWAIAADLAFLPCLILLLGKRLLGRGTARHWLPVAVIMLLAALNGLWYLATAMGTVALAPERILASATMWVGLLIAVIGGRVIPAFTRNRLQIERTLGLPRERHWRDTGALGASALVALAELVEPTAAAALAAVAAVLHASRLWGWRGSSVVRDRLLFVLHVGYAWLPIGYALRTLALLGPAWSGAWGLHGILAGAAGTMTLAMMSRATLGHTGRALRAGVTLTIAFICIQGAAIARLAGPLVDFGTGPVGYYLAGVLWVAAFALFLGRCGPMLLTPRRS